MIPTNYRIYNYFLTTSTVVYTLTFILPILILYEFLCFLQFYNSRYELRNHIDVLFRNLFKNNIIPELLIFFLVLILIIILIIKIKKDDYLKNIKIKYLIFMYLESIFWSLILIIILSDRNLLTIFHKNTIFSNLYLALGAGIWEEFFFRAILIALINYLFYKHLNYNKYVSYFISIFFSSIFFSLFHYLGPISDTFTYNTFIFRFFAGFILGILYLLRGLGISVYTHVFYDIILLTFPIIFLIN